MCPLKTFATLVFFLLIVNEEIYAQDEFQSPCPRLFVYQTKRNEPDKWYGILRLVSETDLSDIRLRLMLDATSLQLGNWFGDVVTTDYKEYLIENRNISLKANVSQFVEFFVRYEPNEPIPKLKSFSLNNRTTCPEELSTETPPVTVVLQTSDTPEAISLTVQGPKPVVQEISFIAERPTTIAQNISLTTERPSIIAQNIGLTTERPTTVVQNINLIPETLTTIAQNINLTTERPTTITQNSNLITEKPSIIAQNIGLTDERPTTFVQNINLIPETSTKIAQNELESPCPRLFVYVKKQRDKWHGNVTLLSETDLSGIWLYLKFDRTSLQLGNWFAAVTTTDNKDYLIENRDFILKANVPYTIRIVLKYYRNGPIPKLVSFSLNNKTVCPEELSTETPPVTRDLYTSPSLETVTVRTTRLATIPKNELQSPCPHLFVYGKEEVDEWYGNVTLLSDRDLSGIWLKLKLDRSSLQLGNSFGEVTTINNKVYLIQNGDFNLKANVPHTVVIAIKYEPNEPIPKLTSFMLNGEAVCPEVPSTETPNQPNPLANTINDFVCGTIIPQPIPLIAYGQPTREGQFPWHVALFHSKGIDLVYKCGASLVSTYHIITAASCVTETKSQKPLNPENLVVYLGKHYLQWFSSAGTQEKAVSDIILHPQYNSQAYSNNIAVIKLKTPAEITDFVRPVCLWQDSTDLSSVLNKQGNVVGWGFDETGEVTEELMLARMPVVSEEVCTFSFPAFYSNFTSNQTYCAGFRNGTSVCNGDTGGGMVFPQSNSNDYNPRWQLRGVVSVSVPSEDQTTCDVLHYVVFTDVAKYLDWITESMQ